MKKYKGISYKYRPSSYWKDTDVLAALLRNVKGQERRKMIQAYWEAGCLEDLNEALLRDTLSEEDRVCLGRVHPRLMGGEYLPDYDTAEVEIARISLESTTGDVISIRAKWQPGGIAYRIVDEYETEFRVARQSSEKPLTLGELIEFIDGSAHPGIRTSLALGYNDMNAENCPRRELRHFTSITSGFYRKLELHYENVFEEWVKEQESEGEKELTAEIEEEGGESRAN